MLQRLKFYGNGNRRLDLIWLFLQNRFDLLFNLNFGFLDAVQIFMVYRNRTHPSDIKRNFFVLLYYLNEGLPNGVPYSQLIKHVWIRTRKVGYYKRVINYVLNYLSCY